ncbi:hypothetical protein DPMN_162034 [Dreissena polymorpha]|uniref:Uncharacterized protein n=1 Tax=Dreissena polymorpha TaxID=45954 RepID=A0A9D4ITY2_DREPO|nr:hypothetical protein DPMN_162034 [Dreissena polymorpha]
MLDDNDLYGLNACYHIVLSEQWQRRCDLKDKRIPSVIFHRAIKRIRLILLTFFS